MSTLTVGNLTLLDLAKRQDPDGSIATIAEILNQTNDIIADVPFVEANGATGHRTTVRTGLPAPTWRKLYGGVLPGKSRTRQVTDSMGYMEAYSQVDKALVDLSGNPQQFRMTEDQAHIEGMGQEYTSTLFYGDESTAPEEFTGLSDRYNSLTAENGGNIVSGGSNDTDNTSIWLISWSPTTVHGIFPKGSKAGLSMKDLGEVTVVESDGSMWQAMRSHYKWDCGLSVRDWRYAVRIANIEVSDLTKAASSGADLVDLMSQALELIPNLNTGKVSFYANRTVRGFLRRQILNKVASSALSIQEITKNRFDLTFEGFPVKRCDALLNTESLVS